MDSRFKGGKDPIRNPLVQKKLEDEFIGNWSKSLKLMKVQIAKYLKSLQK